MIGQTISHYKILEKLGGGGMGVVYKAEDTKLKRTVALKFLPPELTRDPEAKGRFVREAQAASASQHINICAIHDIDETSDGQLFIVMDLYEGETLKTTIERGPLSFEHAVIIGIQVARGLREAHEHHIVHRDIKPANILITDGVVKIVDFGVAKFAGLTKLTRAQSTLGTAAYMSPEQARGEEVDERTDIWSLGVLLYELLSGRLPFRADHEAAMLYSIVNEAHQSLSEIRPEIPPELSAIVDKMLEKDRGSRTPSMAEVIRELSKFQTSEVPGHLAIISWRKLKRPIVAIPCAVVFLGLCYGLYSWIDRSNKVSWAHNVALPEVIRLADAENWSGAFDMARHAAEDIPSDSVLLKYMDRISWIVDLNSDPSGAKLSYKPYSDTSQSWISLGITPVEGSRIPLGVYRIMAAKEGFAGKEVLRDWSYKSFPQETLKALVIRLDSLGAVPAGMVKVLGGQIPLQIPEMDQVGAITSKDYFIDQYEVTNKQFKEFLDIGGYQNRKYWKQPFLQHGRTLSWEEAMRHFKDATGRPGPATWEVGNYPTGTDNFPVGGISWYEAVAYSEYAGKCLPSIFHWDRASDSWHAANIITQSNFSGKGPRAVGVNQAVSGTGVCDMAGNVREWCWNENKGNRFILGGGWNDQPYTFMYAYTQDPFDRSPSNGFRCARYQEVFSDTSRVLREVEIPRRDFLKEKPVSQEVYRLYLRLYAYDKTNLHEKIETSDTTPDWIQQRVTLDAAYGHERLILHVFLPRTASAPYQTVVFFPGADVIYMNSSKLMRTQDFEFFIRSGHVLVFPVYKSTFERNDGYEFNYPDESNVYKEHIIDWVKDLSRTIDYLETRPEIDTDKIAYYGLSLGGYLGGIIPAVESRISLVMLNVGGLHFRRSQPEVDAINFVPHIKVPVLMINGKYDYYFPYETSQRPMYELLGTPRERKKLFVVDASHGVPDVVAAKECLDWIDRYFGPVRTK